jgi:hypothetical protein
MQRAAFSLAAAALVFLTTARSQTIQVDKNNRTIAITATDTASAPADIATVSIGFTAWAPDAASAYQKGSQISNAIFDALKKAGVPDKAIESQEQNLSRTDFPYDNQITPEQRTQRQFTLSQKWTVHTAAKDAAGILHVAIEAGANNSGNIDWNLADRNGLEAQAAQKALIRARTIATQMATGLGAQLGPLIYASNQAPERGFVPMKTMFGSLGRGAIPAPPPVPLAIRPQQVQESATVYAVFSVE